MITDTPSSLNVSAFAPVHGHFGYGIHSRSTLLALRQYVNRLHVKQSLDPTDCNCAGCADMRRLIDQQNPMPDPDVHVAFTPAPAFHHRPCTSFLFTTVESYVAHYAIVRACSQWDRLIVPSCWTADALMRAGIPRSEISVCPEGVSRHYAYTLPPPAAVTSLRRAIFPNSSSPSDIRLLYHGDFSTRKAVHQLCFAFGKAHKVNPSIYLTLAACPGGRRDPHAHTDITQQAQHFVREAHPPALQNFHITTSYITPAQQIALYHTAQIFIHLGRGEAWNLTVGEAHAAGSLIIAPAFGAHVEFLLDEPWLPVHSAGISTLDQPDLVKVWHHQNVPFLRVDIEHAAIQMLEAARIIAGRSGTRFPPRRQFANRFSWQVAARKLAHILNTYARKEHYRCTWSPSQRLQYAPRFLSSLSHAPYTI